MRPAAFGQYLGSRPGRTRTRATRRGERGRIDPAPALQAPPLRYPLQARGRHRSPNTVLTTGERLGRRPPPGLTSSRNPSRKEDTRSDRCSMFWCSSRQNAALLEAIRRIHLVSSGRSLGIRDASSRYYPARQRRFDDLDTFAGQRGQPVVHSTGERHSPCCLVLVVTGYSSSGDPPLINDELKTTCFAARERLAKPELLLMGLLILALGAGCGQYGWYQ